MTTVTVQSSRFDKLSFAIILPALLKAPTTILLHLDSGSKVSIALSAGQAISLTSNEIRLCKSATHRIFFSIFRSRMKPEDQDFPLLIHPQGLTSDLQGWLTQTAGTYPASQIVETASKAGLKAHPGLVRLKGQELSPFVIQDVACLNHDHLEEALPRAALKAYRFSRNVSLWTPSEQCPSAPLLLDPQECMIDTLPIEYAYLAKMMPCIMHRLQRSLIVDRLCNHELQTIKFDDRSLILQAITTPGVMAEPNYERLEFVGDCLLKTYVAVAAMAQNLAKVEGYLTRFKDHIVSNSSLALVARKLHLDQYILTSINSFRGARWKPPQNSVLLQAVTEEREMSTKSLADVVEALLGAAFIDGQEARLLQLLQLYFPETTWCPLEESFVTISKSSAVDASVPTADSFLQAEKLLGHTFDCRPLLLEALTHPSYVSASPSPSYQRLEFLGDAVLDYLVTRVIFDSSSRLSPARMTSIRKAAVNSHLLAFLALRAATYVPYIEFSPPTTENQTPTLIASTARRTLLDFLRRGQAQPELAEQVHAVRERFAAIEPAVSSALRDSNVYPWVLLTSLCAPKLVSDLVESTLGALAVDSRGDLGPCKAWLETLGMLPWLRRVLSEDMQIEVMHPKETVGILASRLDNESKLRYETSSGPVLDGVDGDEAVAEPTQGCPDDPIARLLGKPTESRRQANHSRWTCRIMLGERKIIVANGIDKNTAIVASAEKGAPILRAELHAKKSTDIDKPGLATDVGDIDDGEQDDAVGA